MSDKSTNPETAAETPPPHDFAWDRRHKAIREAAYFKARERGFIPSHELEDWLDAEKEIDEASKPAPSYCGTSIPVQPLGASLNRRAAFRGTRLRWRHSRAHRVFSCADQQDFCNYRPFAAGAPPVPITALEKTAYLRTELRRIRIFGKNPRDC
mgnify:FL=1